MALFGGVFGRTVKPAKPKRKPYYTRDLKGFKAAYNDAGRKYAPTRKLFELNDLLTGYKRGKPWWV